MWCIAMHTAYKERNKNKTKTKQMRTTPTTAAAATPNPKEEEEDNNDNKEEGEEEEVTVEQQQPKTKKTKRKSKNEHQNKETTKPPPSKRQKKRPAGAAEGTESKLLPDTTTLCSPPLLARKVCMALKEDVLSLKEDAANGMLPEFTSFAADEESNLDFIVQRIRRECPTMCKERKQELVDRIMHCITSSSSSSSSQLKK
jgi:hypothetical protein